MSFSQHLAFLICVVFTLTFMTLETSVAAGSKQAAVKSKQGTRHASRPQARRPAAKKAASKHKKGIRHASRPQARKSVSKRAASKHKKGTKYSLRHQTRRPRYKRVALNYKYRHRAPSCYLQHQQGLGLCSHAVLIQDQATGAVLYAKNASAVRPIASITKLMTAMVVLDAGQPLEHWLTIGYGDVDFLRGTRSRLPVGALLTREDMLRLALMSSENRAASVLARHYPGGTQAFVRAMNYKASALGLRDTYFLEPTGLSSANISSARDLVKLVAAAHRYPMIREFTTTPQYAVYVGGRPLLYRNTNSLVNSPVWNIGLSKTGFIRASGMCLVMQAWLDRRPVIMVLLNSPSRFTRIGDANRIREWFKAAITDPRWSVYYPR
jgi:D-alanyl-D-alanine endopeptidase (penicillin-binding protein 7)